jgi:predicted Zn-dependent peptidase
MDLRYETIKSRLSTLSKEEIQRILDNIDQVCFDEFNYDEANNKYCPLAIAMKLDTLPNPTDSLIKEEIGKRFNPVNAIKGVAGDFYRDNRKENLINLCKKLLSM